MSNTDLNWVVDVETIAPWGLCERVGSLLDDLDESREKHYATAADGSSGFTFVWHRRIGEDANRDGEIDGPTYRLTLNYNNSVTEFWRNTYDLPVDAQIQLEPRVTPSNFVLTNRAQEYFATEAEALEYVDTIPEQPTIVTFNEGDYILRASLRYQVDGVWIDRNVAVVHEGDPVKIYTIDDLINFYTILLGDGPFFITGSYRIGQSGGSFGGGYYLEDIRGLPDVNCPTSLNITVFNLEEDVSSTITVEPDFQGIPGSSTVTIVDGDPVVSGTMLENGGGSVTVSDNGNISMLNDGGTFFLNEFGNVGFFANGDASLTANTQVQLGSGGTTFNVDSNGLNMRDSTGTVSFTADELSRLKDLLS